MTMKTERTEASRAVKMAVNLPLSINLPMLLLRLTELVREYLPTTAKEVQRLTGMAAALNKFISRSSDKCRAFFQLLKKREGYEWGAECERAFQDLKKYLVASPLLSTPELGESLILYFAVSEHAISAVLLRNRGPEQIPIYYVSKTLLDAEMRYLPLEKLVLALRTTVRKLPHYFQSHKIVVYTEFPLRSLLRRQISREESRRGQ
ncbi:uncharacterized protein LOC131306837 [Rhododendron vialii]|uniref:uncharacterized protein LOC131306837 n=1 Tax=Rhododendron vialii TaxID=182163 RepID=UPI00265FA0ED|nr:uncharacterized protein LOC131306837 [Rhododendron vialii]